MPRKPKAPEPPKDSRCCGTCRHWQRMGDVGEAATDGECYRYPGMPFLTDEGIVAIRPVYSVDEKPCGEHAPVLQ